jgi:diamine N-acetyltransferase
VRLVAGIARDEGASQLVTSYAAGEGSPESFYRQIGFVPTAEEDEKAEKVLSLRLRD